MLAGAHRLGTATVVIDSAILVFREGLETILVLAAITASFLGAHRMYRRPVAAGSSLALAAGVLTWFEVVWLIGRFHGSELSIQAATGIPALIVLLIVMNWFFHKVLLDRVDRAPPSAAPGTCCSCSCCWSRSTRCSSPAGSAPPRSTGSRSPAGWGPG